MKVDEQRAIFDRFWNEEWLPKVREEEARKHGRTDGKASSV